MARSILLPCPPCGPEDSGGSKGGGPQEACSRQNRAVPIFHLQSAWEDCNPLRRTPVGFCRRGG